jgi:lipopolysaccharide/colanic/teichoic acid biosynthesis glycosyltransferase
VAALTAVSPILAGVLAAVRILSRRPPLIALQRIGLDGEPFWLMKIRTMWDQTHGGSTASGWIEHLTETFVPLAKNAPDPRVSSRFAAFCRRYSIDELPQLWHIVTGRMQWVGPRPLTAQELDVYYGADAAEVLSVMPGLTGLWQVMGRNKLTYAQRRRLDLFFVRKATAGLYLRILARTPLRVLSGRDAW